MKILLSEAPPDYDAYVFPYVVWGFPEPGDSPASAFARGFLPSLPDLSRYYLCRQIRVRLAGYAPSSENRRILRHGVGIECTILERADFEWTEARRAYCERSATARWTTPPAPGRIERIFHAPLCSHVALFRDAQGQDKGLVTLFRDERSWFYSNAFHDPAAPPGSGAFLMTTLVGRLASLNQEFLYLGTCYSRSALYKTQFPGTEFFRGDTWSTSLGDLKARLAREETKPDAHLLEDDEYVQRWVPEGLATRANAGDMTWRPT